MAEAILPQAKTCTKCRLDKPLDEYHKHKRGKYGLQPKCKSCVLEENAAYKAVHREEGRAYNKAYYEQNRDEVLAKHAQWAKGNREKVSAKSKRWRDACPERAKEVRDRYNSANVEKTRARSKQYREENRDAFLAAQAKWREANREHIAAYNRAEYATNQADRTERTRKWRKANPEAVTAMCRQRRARKNAASGSHTAADVAQLLVEQDHRCANPYCRADLRLVKKELDHKQPLARGGSNGPENLQWLCAPCNRRKHAKPMDEWLAAEERRSRKAA